MQVNLEKLEKIVKPRSQAAIDRAKARKKNREWLRISQDIALILHYTLRTKGMTQSEFAQKMGVSPAYVAKLLKGNENLTLETISKLQKVLDISLISVPKPYYTYISSVFLSPYTPSNQVVNSDPFYNEQISSNVTCSVIEIGA